MTLHFVGFVTGCGVISKNARYVPIKQQVFRNNIVTTYEEVRIETVENRVTKSNLKDYHFYFLNAIIE